MSVVFHAYRRTYGRRGRFPALCRMCGPSGQFVGGVGSVDAKRDFGLRRRSVFGRCARLRFITRWLSGLWLGTTLRQSFHEIPRLRHVRVQRRCDHLLDLAPAGRAFQRLSIRGDLGRHVDLTLGTPHRLSSMKTGLARIPQRGRENTQSRGFTARSNRGVPPASIVRQGDAHRPIFRPFSGFPHRGAVGHSAARDAEASESLPIRRRLSEGVPSR